ncbi:MFS transporter [uncultured Thermanaerothrix sp.]|uniref:MFS transporter n=1 Tax=uncultured Thermanaerothrix sp. TaxID=1195149 RepID=UPI002619F35A|nr:MFS transporter [uncultured Thermanaerothrix sp.]
MNTTPPSLSPTENPRWLRRFAPIWIGQVFSLFGSGLVHFSLIWWLTQTTGSAVVLATASFVGFLPQIVLGPFVGALVDRWNRRRVMMLADSGIALATLGLVLLFALGLAQPWHIYVVLFLRSLGGAFHWPAMQASTTLLVPERHLARVAGANQALNGLINIVAPPSGALLLDVLPLQGVLAIDVVTAFIAVGLLGLVQIPQPVRLDAQRALTPRVVLRDVHEGLRYLAGWPGMLALLLMATLINFLLNPAFALLPLLVTRHFNGTAIHLGWLESGYGIGVVLGGLILSVWGGFRRKLWTSMSGLFILGVGAIGMGLLPPSAYPIALGLMFWMGIANPITNGPLFALVQARVAPEIQGRVFTVISSLATAMTPLGMLIAGPVAEWLGLQTWYIVGGTGCALMSITALIWPVTANLETQPGPHMASADSSA